MLSARVRFLWETQESAGMSALFVGAGIPCDMFGQVLRENGLRME
jgi:hypothetical protein